MNQLRHGKHDFWKWKICNIFFSFIEETGIGWTWHLSYDNERVKPIQVWHDFCFHLNSNRQRFSIRPIGDGRWRWLCHAWRNETDIVEDAPAEKLHNYSSPRHALSNNRGSEKQALIKGAEMPRFESARSVHTYTHICTLDASIHVVQIRILIDSVSWIAFVQLIKLSFRESVWMTTAHTIQSCFHSDVHEAHCTRSHVQHAERGQWLEQSRYL